MTPGPATGWLLILLLAALPVAAEQPETAQAAQAWFQELIDESGLQFAPPAGFADIPPRPNPVLQYERALRHDSGDLEMRFVIRPLGRISIDYNDPHNAAPEPNHLFPLLFESLTAELSSGTHSPSSEYPAVQARELFNATWAAAAVFDLNPDFSDSYSQALMLAIHNDGKADAYTLFLYNDPEKARDLIQGALATLAFAP